MMLQVELKLYAGEIESIEVEDDDRYKHAIIEQMKKIGAVSATVRRNGKIINRIFPPKCDLCNQVNYDLMDFINDMFICPTCKGRIGG